MCLISPTVDEIYQVQKGLLSPLSCFANRCSQAFSKDFYPGETVTVHLDNGERYAGYVREKTKFPELVARDGSLERPAFARYFIHLDDRPGEEALVDQDHLMRDRNTFTKQRLRSFLKNSVTREAWAGAPWLVKQRIAEEYRITTDVPEYLTHEYQVKQRKASAGLNKRSGDYEGPILNFYGPQHGLPMLKPKGNKARSGHEAMRLEQEQYAQYQRALASDPNFHKVGPQGQAMQFDPFYHGHPPPGFQQTQNGFKPIASKGQVTPAPPPAPKYPIEDLEIPPLRDGTNRPPLKYLSETTPTKNQQSDGAGSGIDITSVGLLLETWDTLNVYCEVFQLDSFTFDDFVEALRFSSEDIQCELLVEIHCAVIKKLVNDTNDKNGQVQIILPFHVDSEEEDSTQNGSTPVSPTPEPEVKPPARSTRSSLVKAEAVDLKAASAIQSSLANAKVHRAQEMDHSVKGYDWKMRARKRDFQDGRWVVIAVGLLNLLSRSPRISDRQLDDLNEILKHLSPLDQDPTPETAALQYQTLDINLRIKVLQILCMKSVETKAIRQYMEDCSAQMTETRKEKNDVQRQRKAA